MSAVAEARRAPTLPAGELLGESLPLPSPAPPPLAPSPPAAAARVIAVPPRIVPAPRPAPAPPPAFSTLAVTAAAPAIDAAELRRLTEALAASRRVEQELWAALEKEREARSDAIARLTQAHEKALNALRAEIAGAHPARTAAGDAPPPRPAAAGRPRAPASDDAKEP